jgi:hypothetical protein
MDNVGGDAETLVWDWDSGIQAAIKLVGSFGNLIITSPVILEV